MRDLMRHFWWYCGLVMRVTWVSAVVVIPLLLGLGIDYNPDPFHGVPYNENGVAIIGTTLRLNLLLTSQKLSMRWFVIGCGEYMLRPTAGTPGEYPPPDRAVDIYLDNSSSPAFSYDPANLPMIRTGGKSLPPEMVSFDVEHRVTMGSQYATPFDQYNFTVFAFAVERATNKSVPITLFAVGDAGPADFTTTSESVPSSNWFTYDTEDGPVTTKVESSTTFAKVEHSTRARALTLSMFLINWVLTIFSMIITAIVTSSSEVKGGVALLPFSVIFTIPTIRSLFVGSPPFGILFDVVGFFPQMLLVIVCTMVVLSVSLMDRGDVHKKVAV